jgi:hypothetical protein
VFTTCEYRLTFAKTWFRTFFGRQPSFHRKYTAFRKLSRPLFPYFRQRKSMPLKIIHEFGILNVVIVLRPVHFYRYVEHLGGRRRSVVFKDKDVQLCFCTSLDQLIRVDSVIMTSRWSRRWSTFCLVVGNIDHSAHPGMNATLKSVRANRQV